jgi:hypothetical protein
MYYRIAIQADPSQCWTWRSTPLDSLNVVMRWLLFYSALPRHHLRVFSSASRDDLCEQLVRENAGVGSTSVPATYYLPEQRRGPDAHRPDGNMRQAESRSTMVGVTGAPIPDARSSGLLAHSPLETRREALERGSGGDHDVSYRFRLPIEMPQVLAWVRLMVRVQQGDLQSEVIPVAAATGAGAEALGDISAPQPTYALLRGCLQSRL